MEFPKILARLHSQGFNAQTVRRIVGPTTYVACRTSGTPAAPTKPGVCSISCLLVKKGGRDEEGSGFYIN